MPELLRTRAISLPEKMDAPDCDARQLTNTYRDFATVNALISGWYALYCTYVRPALRKAGQGATLLDIGCGGGDLLRQLARWTVRDGLGVEFTGIDPDERAVAYARSVSDTPENIRYRLLTAHDLVEQKERFDVVISNHVLHHLTEEEVVALCADSAYLATRGVVHADIHRSPLAYAMFPLLGIWFRDSFILEDGLRSIRRSFTPTELARLAPEGWQTRTHFPFRSLLLWIP